MALRKQEETCKLSKKNNKMRVLWKTKNQLTTLFCMAQRHL